jgi:hypothetical protein
METHLSEGHVVGTLGAERSDVARWTEPPHKRLANLLTRDTRTGELTPRPVSGLADPKAMEAFVRRYGVLCGRVDETSGRFDEDAATFAEAQDTLRRAWMGDREAMRGIEAQIQDALEANPSVRAGGIELATENLWSLICMLFLLDHAGGKTAVCANPDCPAPYFLRKRKDQKFCEMGQCTAHAQRQYALKWWRKEGPERRAKRLKEQSRKRRKRA